MPKSYLITIQEKDIQKMIIGAVTRAIRLHNLSSDKKDIPRPKFQKTKLDTNTTNLKQLVDA